MFRRRPPAPAPPAPPTTTGAASGSSLRDRLGRSGQAVLVAAVAQAQADGSASTDEPHLLLAVVAVPSPTAWTLATRGLDEARLRDALDRVGGVPHPTTDRRTPQRPVPGAAQPSFSDGATRMLQVALEVAARRGRPKAEVDDIALAVLGTTAAPVVDSLADLGLDAKELRAALLAPPPPA